MTTDYITIPLSKRGKYAGKYETIISVEDAILAELNWSVGIHRHIYYAYRYPQKHRIQLHREIMKRKLGRELESYEDVDHIDGNGLNNTRPNLRLATQSQNSANRRISKNNTSGYKGVYWKEKNKKWCAQIKFNQKKIYLGLFDTKEQAHEAYCKKAVELFGEYANFG